MTGASYVCVVERDSARVLGDIGGNDGEAVDIGSVAALGRDAGNMFSWSDADGVEDLMVNSRHCFHVLRQIDVPAGPVVLVYIRLLRGRANPAMARRELASAQVQRALIDALTARPEPAPEPVASVVSFPPRYPPPAAPEPVASPAPRPAPPSSPVALPAPRTPLSATATGPQQPALATLSGMLSATASRSDWAVAAIGQVADLRTPAATSPPAPGAVPEVPPPGPAEDAVLLPLPRRTAGTRPPPPMPRQRSAERVDQGGRTSSVLTQAWARDLNTMQRLVAGLRRLV
ncbi:hypothetical protein [Pseudonocardia acidicola]|uniref:FHA domain-containing protein n=1 Tax=Pseudonocardia acidicola TaxID=2724939 RepID=A0ABX1SLG0_9PSEU|nr:hypothetical protein [Pseudonocardia acidicola]NMI01633.1 hypothetical protein [Pseudonocardia acidicola]